MNSQGLADYITDCNLDQKLPNSDPSIYDKMRPTKGREHEGYSSEPEILSNISHSLDHDNLINPTHLMNRHVSTPLLLRQLGGSTEFPDTADSISLPKTDNPFREILETSYFELGEDSDDEDIDEEEDPLTPALLPQERASLFYSNFTPLEKLNALNGKIRMLQNKAEMEEKANGSASPLTMKLLDLLVITRVANEEEDTVHHISQERCERDDEVNMV